MNADSALLILGILGMPVIQYANHITNRTYGKIKDAQERTAKGTLKKNRGVNNIFNDCSTKSSSKLPSMIDKGKMNLTVNSQ